MNLFEKYTQHQATPLEADQMTEQLVTDKFNQELRQQMGKRLAQEYGITRNGARGQLRLLRWVVAAAAVIGLTVVGWQFLSGPPTPQTTAIALAESYLDHHFADPRDRKGLVDFDELRAEAANAYNQRDFPAAISRYESLFRATEKQEIVDYLFLGISYLSVQPPQPQKAITALETISNNAQNEYPDETAWFLTIAYVLAGDMDKAKPLLKVRIEQGDWNQEKAAQLLQYLE